MLWMHDRPAQCCIAKRQVLLDIVLTVVRNGLRILLPALSSFQPFPSEMFGACAEYFKLLGRLLRDAGLFSWPRRSLLPADHRHSGQAA
jgi:hypothetical protein